MVELHVNVAQFKAVDADYIILKPFAETVNVVRKYERFLLVRSDNAEYGIPLIDEDRDNSDDEDTVH